ncbi:MAG: virulence RhuM family protein [Oscillospiraceae bacterium]|nr:virulence RhuM family protein [Oscillospiraceae bacterium]
MNKHLSNIYEDGELTEYATVSKMEIVQTEVEREVKRKLSFYNLDTIISVG